MLLNFSELIRKYNLKIKGVVQVGANKGQETQQYFDNGINNIVLIEPCKDAFNVLVEKFGNDNRIKLYKTACGNIAGKSVMYTEHTNQGMSNSLLEPKVHLTQHKEVVFDDAELVDVCLLDELDFDRSSFNLLNMDVQGFEDRVLKGASETLKTIDYILTEVNREEMYSGNAMIEDLDKILSDFTRVETGWASPNHGWGDACYIRKTLL